MSSAWRESWLSVREERAWGLGPFAVVSHWDVGEMYGSYKRLRQAVVRPQDLDLPSLFASMEAARAELGVEEYSISQTTLEHVFVALAEVGTQQDSAVDTQ